MKIKLSGTTKRSAETNLPHVIPLPNNKEVTIYIIIKPTEYPTTFFKTLL